MTDKKWDWAYASHTLTPKRPHIKHMPTFVSEIGKRPNTEGRWQETGGIDALKNLGKMSDAELNHYEK